MNTFIKINSDINYRRKPKKLNLKLTPQTHTSNCYLMIDIYYGQIKLDTSKAVIYDSEKDDVNSQLCQFTVGKELLRQINVASDRIIVGNESFPDQCVDDGHTLLYFTDGSMIYDSRHFLMLHDAPDPDLMRIGDIYVHFMKYIDLYACTRYNDEIVRTRLEKYFGCLFDLYMAENKSIYMTAILHDSDFDTIRSVVSDDVIVDAVVYDGDAIVADVGDGKLMRLDSVFSGPDVYEEVIENPVPYFTYSDDCNLSDIVIIEHNSPEFMGVIVNEENLSHLLMIDKGFVMPADVADSVIYNPGAKVMLLNIKFMQDCSFKASLAYLNLCRQSFGHHQRLFTGVSVVDRGFSLYKLFLALGYTDTLKNNLRDIMELTYTYGMVGFNCAYRQFLASVLMRVRSCYIDKSISIMTNSVRHSGVIYTDTLSSGNLRDFSGPFNDLPDLIGDDGQVDRGNTYIGVNFAFGVRQSANVETDVANVIGHRVDLDDDILDRYCPRSDSAVIRRNRSNRGFCHDSGGSSFPGLTASRTRLGVYKSRDVIPVTDFTHCYLGFFRLGDRLVIKDNNPPIVSITALVRLCKIYGVGNHYVTVVKMHSISGLSHYYHVYVGQVTDMTVDDYYGTCKDVVQWLCDTANYIYVD